MNVSKLVEFRESERSPVGQQACSGRGILGIATSVDCIFLTPPFVLLFISVAKISRTCRVNT